MATFLQQRQRAEKVTPKAISYALFNYVKSIQKEIVDINRKQLNEDSIDAFGKPIGFYSYATEIITRGAKKRGEPFDAEDTGDFLRGFYIEVRGDNIFFNSRDPKTGIILQSEHWLSHDLFGLTDDNLKGLIEKRLLPFVLKYYRQQLQI